jgi:dTDP-4-dehydrorhamnose 3,5-epimerase-like enzyme
MNYKLVNFHIFGDERGSLISLESMENVPFDIKRIYYIYNTKLNQERGKHAHINLEQMIVCISGSCEIILDDGITRESIAMNRPDIGLYVGKNIWREMRNFSMNCILMVLASEHYDEKEYIRDYSEFLDFTRSLA